MISQHGKISVVVTSISTPTAAMQELAAGCAKLGYDFYVVGDVKTPPDFRLPGCDYFGLDRQAQTGFRSAEVCPLRCYARKNIGYLLAIQGGADVIVETDDDNAPTSGFWSERQRRVAAPVVRHGGWLNVYSYFCDNNIWPRGLPLDAVRVPWAEGDGHVDNVDCPIQQGLCDGDPDVDAIYRLLLPLPISFASGRSIAFGEGSWSPFNSQNTTWWADAFPLMYLPGTCSIRATDIWRSFIAQRVAWANGWSVLFHSPTVYQDRNPHDLMRDFKDEVICYLNNRRIGEALDELTLRAGSAELAANIRLCYEALVRLGVMDAAELTLLEAWLADLRELECARQNVLHATSLPQGASATQEQ